MTKILAMYLPQFYEIEQNNKWWGEGFTEWTNVKNGRSLFKKHRQPRVPYNKNYYCLEDIETIKWQAKIARENGIFGFCIYHYWFEGTQIMQIPPEILLMNHNIDIHYCFSWANPNRYENYLYHQLIKSERKGNQWLFLTAWNEWSEGAYLEPDEDYRYEYLKATKKAVNRLKGFNTNGK